MGKELNEQSIEQLNYQHRFEMSLKLIKKCAQSCGLFNQTAFQNQKLRDSDQECFKQCGNNIKMTFNDFHQKVVEANVSAQFEGMGEDEE